MHPTLSGVQEVPITGWPHGRSANGGIDQIPLPISTGALWLAGKHLVCPDVARAMSSVGATIVVCLTEAHELHGRYPQYLEWLRNGAEGRAVWFAIPDLGVPALDELNALIDDLVVRLADGESLLVHCAAGFGRSGTVAACLLIALGMMQADALRLIALSRPMAGPEVGAQRDLVRSFVDYAQSKL